MSLLRSFIDAIASPDIRSAHFCKSRLLRFQKDVPYIMGILDSFLPIYIFYDDPSGRRAKVEKFGKQRSTVSASYSANKPTSSLTLPPTSRSTSNANASSLSLSVSPPPPLHPRHQYGGRTSPVPPQYVDRPTEPIVYGFRNQPASTMLLVSLHARSPHVYHISVDMNCFTPTSFITTIRKKTYDGEYVGDFEMGPSTIKTGTVCLRGNEYPISEVLEAPNATRLFRNGWVWKTKDHNKPINIYWDETLSNKVLTCFSSKDRIGTNLLAKFSPRVHYRRQGRVEEAKLEVTPKGHDFFDDILISMMIIERIRTNP